MFLISLIYTLIFEVCLWPCVGVGARGAQVVCGARDPEARWSGVASSPFVITSLCACCSSGSRFVCCACALVVFEVTLGVLVFGGHRRHGFPSLSLSIAPLLFV